MLWGIITSFRLELGCENTAKFYPQAVSVHPLNLDNGSANIQLIIVHRVSGQIIKVFSAIWTGYFADCFPSIENGL